MNSLVWDFASLNGNFSNILHHLTENFKNVYPRYLKLFKINSAVKNQHSEKISFLAKKILNFAFILARWPLDSRQIVMYAFFSTKENALKIAKLRSLWEKRKRSDYTIWRMQILSCLFLKLFIYILALGFYFSMWRSWIMMKTCACFRSNNKQKSCVYSNIHL